MILNKNLKETDAIVNINNDIYRIITIFNDTQELKQFLVNTGKNPLQSEKITKDLRDTQICRVPLLPYDEEQGSLVVVTLINGDVDQKSGSIISTLAIDVFTPGNQWIINEGIRPLQIAHVINNLMKFKVNQKLKSGIQWARLFGGAGGFDFSDFDINLDDILGNMFGGGFGYNQPFEMWF